MSQWQNLEWEAGGRKGVIEVEDEFRITFRGEHRNHYILLKLTRDESKWNVVDREDFDRLGNLTERVFKLEQANRKPWWRFLR